MGTTIAENPFKTGQFVVFNSKQEEWNKNLTTGKTYIVLETVSTAFTDRGAGPTTYNHKIRICNDIGIVDFYGSAYFAISLHEYLRSQPCNDARLQRWVRLMQITFGLAQPFVNLYQAMITKLTRPEVA